VLQLAEQLKKKTSQVQFSSLIKQQLQKRLPAADIHLLDVTDLLRFVINRCEPQYFPEQF